MYRESYPHGSLIVLKRGEMMPHHYQLSSFYYAFDEDKWVPRNKTCGPTFYRFNHPDPHEKVKYLEEFLRDEPEAIVFIYAHDNGFFTAVKDK